MSGYANSAIRGEKPWGSNARGVQDEPREPAAAQDVTYECERCGPVTRRYAAGVEYEDAVDCRCGKTARLPGTPHDAQAATPKYGPPPYLTKGRTADDITPWAQLRKRRTIAELEEQLAERLAAVRGEVT